MLNRCNTRIEITFLGISCEAFSRILLTLNWTNCSFKIVEFGFKIFRKVIFLLKLYAWLGIKYFSFGQRQRYKTRLAVAYDLFPGCPTNHNEAQRPSLITFFSFNPKCAISWVKSRFLHFWVIFSLFCYIHDIRQTCDSFKLFDAPTSGTTIVRWRLVCSCWSSDELWEHARRARRPITARRDVRGIWFVTKMKLLIIINWAVAFTNHKRQRNIIFHLDFTWSHDQLIKTCYLFVKKKCFTNVVKKCKLWWSKYNRKQGSCLNLV